MASAHKLNGASARWPEVAFAASPARALALAAGSVAFTVLGATMAFGWFEAVEPWSKGWLAAWVCLIFFPLCGVLWFKQALAGGPVVTVGPRGIRDTRISPDWIPWSAIAGISETSVKGTHFLILRIDPAFEASMSLTPLARLGRRGNAALGFGGYGIAATGLRGGFKALKEAVQDGLARAHGAYGAPGSPRGG